MNDFTVTQHFVSSPHHPSLCCSSCLHRSSMLPLPFCYHSGLPICWSSLIPSAHGVPAGASHDREEHIQVWILNRLSKARAGLCYPTHMEPARGRWTCQTRMCFCLSAVGNRQQPQQKCVGLLIMLAHIQKNPCRCRLLQC